MVFQRYYLFINWWTNIR